MDPVCGIALGFLYTPTRWSSAGLSEWAAAGQPRGCCAAVPDPLQAPRSPQSLWDGPALGTQPCAVWLLLALTLACEGQSSAGN